MTRERMDFDVVIVGAGSAGLATAIHLAELTQQSLSICVIEKSAEIGGHILSGAVLDPTSLNELIPGWEKKYPFPLTAATQDEFYILSSSKAWRFPTPPQMKNPGNYILSLSQLTKWLGEYAATLNINIFPGFSGVEVLYDQDRVVGIATGDKGVDKNGQPTARFQAGVELYAKQTVFAEGCRGSLTETVIKRFDLRKNADPQTYAIGIKELWEIPKELHKPGSVMHTMGWPLDSKTYGGSFVYHFAEQWVSLGLVVGLDYENTFLNPYEELQRFKTHPKIKPLLEKGKRLAYGARCLNEGGFQSIPKLTFPGGMLVGCAAGFVNVPKIKGVHNAIRSGMIAAKNIKEHLNEKECISYPTELQKSPLWEELYRVRNIRPAMRMGLWPGLAYAGLDTYIFRGKAPWTFKNKEDYLQLKPAAAAQKILYPKHDNQITFDLMSSVYLTNSVQNENQPCHLKIKNPTVEIEVNLKKFAAPEERYCPAGVYEIIYDNGKPRLQIHASNCIQCKACDIKDPTQNIVWTPPEGGTGPQYSNM